MARARHTVLPLRRVTAECGSMGGSPHEMSRHPGAEPVHSPELSHSLHRESRDSGGQWGRVMAPGGVAPEDVSRVAVIGRPAAIHVAPAEI